MNFINNITGKYQVLLEKMFINNLFIRVTSWLESRFSGHQAHKQQLLLFAAIIKPSQCPLYIYMYTIIFIER